MLQHVLMSVMFIAVAGAAVAEPASRWPAYRWHEGARAANTLEATIAPPSGFRRVPAEPGSFAAWLRGLPMKQAGAPVMLFNGGRKARQDLHVRVVDIDIGRRDLQQCADAIMRLRAEWLFGAGRSGEIAFNYTGGGRVPFSRWAEGQRPSEDGKRWSSRARADSSYKQFRRYMTQVFAYAGTYSLAREMKPVLSSRIEIGDVFIKGGFPGHGVLVADVVENKATGERRFLLIQSYMPAQDMHVIKNPAAANGSPWYPQRFSWPLTTPEWSFLPGSHRRWPGRRG